MALDELPHVPNQLVFIIGFPEVNIVDIHL